MITEDYVNFEIAKLLKEKGFNGECKRIFRVLKNFGPKVYDCPEWITNDNLCDLYQNCEFATIPTLQMTIKWLRELKGIAIIPILSSILDNEKFLWDIKIVVAKTSESYSQGWVYENQESAYKAAIKYCLENLI